ncbi:MAG: dioxygenase [Natronospirillum sp.]|uniref:DODA-type extradiol aromatic ring-opening family dioxygenase n=1 Tax=Natronospirillum sp. TaxID=2812955 RepID=UPI0025E73872|nr:class III extradiol ring-cleavage dioxygenase [Natronospirillum sp.]MCH8551682.1 dioxygenase [Natronospirillum sp.]
MPAPIRLPTYFISHGGGPWPWMERELGDQYRVLRTFLQDLPGTLPDAPKAILVITGHWETETLRISAGERPGMIYDYYNFPPHTYEVSYPAPGDPTLASRISTLLEQSGFNAQLDPERGFDHGTFVPLSVMYPEAKVPVVMLSMLNHRDPATHMALGQALAPLRDEGVLIIGSGLSYHNLRLMNQAGAEPSRQFDDWLQDTLTQQDTNTRMERLQHWSQAPGARIAHAEEDHLVPLFVAAGAAEEDRGECVHHEPDFFGHITVSSFRFG